MSKAKRRANREGTIHLRADGRHEARYYDRDGKRQSIYGKRNGKREVVHDLLIEALSGVRNNRPVAKAPARLTVAEYLEQWRESKRNEVGPNTYRRYEQVVRLDLGPAFGKKRLGKLSAGDVRDPKNTLLANGAAPATVAYVQGVLSTAMNQAARDGLIPANPGREVRKPRTSDDYRMRALKPEEARRLLSAVRGRREEAYFTLAVKTGMRQGELAGLRWDDLDFEAGTISVRRSATTSMGGTIWTSPKGGGGRTIRLGEKMLELLTTHRETQREEAKAAAKAAKEWNDHRVLFANYRGSVTRKTSVSRDFHRALAKAELPRIRFHDLRHTAATLMLRAGVSVRTVADILGHKDPAMTLRRYSHVLSDMQDEAARKMDESLA